MRFAFSSSGYVLSFAVRLAGAASSLAAQVVFVRLLGPGAYGGYVWILTIAALLGIVSRGGLDVIATRKAALPEVRRQPLAFGAATVIASLRIASLTLIPLAGCVGLLYLSTDKSGDVNVALFVGIVATAALLNNVTLVLIGVLRGIRQFLSADVLDSLARPVFTVAFLGAAVLVLSKLEYRAITDFEYALTGVASYIAVNWLLTIVLYVLLSRANSEPSTSAPVLNAPKRDLAYSSHLVSSSLLSFGMFQLDTLVLGIYASALETGAYAVACSYVRLVIFVPLIIVSRRQVEFAEAWQATKPAEFVRLVNSASRQSVVAGGGAAFFLTATASYWMGLASPAYRDFAVVLWILSLVHVFNSAALVLNSALCMAGRERLANYSTFAGFFVACVAYALLIPTYHALGAACSVFLGVVAMTVVSYTCMRRLQTELDN